MHACMRAQRSRWGLWEYRDGKIPFDRPIARRLDLPSQFVGKISYEICGGGGCVEGVLGGLVRGWWCYRLR